VGGGTGTEELTLPGFRHDVCSAIHPLARLSPAFRDLGLDVDWIESPAADAHPFDDGSAVALVRDLRATAAQLGVDGAAYVRLVAPVAPGLDQLARGPVPRAGSEARGRGDACRSRRRGIGVCR